VDGIRTSSLPLRCFAVAAALLGAPGLGWAQQSPGPGPAPTFFAPLQVEAALEKKEQLLRELLMAGMLATGAFSATVTPETEEAWQQCVRDVNRDSTSEQCWVRLGHGQGARWMVTGQLRGAPKRCHLSLRFTELETRLSRRMHVAVLEPCDDAALTSEIQRGARVLAGSAPEPTALAAALPSPVLSAAPIPTPIGAGPATNPAAPAAAPAVLGPVPGELLPVDGAPVLGPDEARVTLVVFADFQCPFSARVQPVLKQLRDTFPTELRVAFFHNPLRFHARARRAAEAALAAGEQGKFWEMHDLLFERQNALMDEDLVAYADRLGLDTDRFERDMKGGRFLPRIEHDSLLAARLGARGTPGFFVNGSKLVGARPFETFESAVRRELQEVDRLLGQGVPLRELYARRVASNLAKEQ